LLERSLRRSFKAAPRDAIVDAVVDALVDYIRRPERFEPSREVPLRAWLRLAATRDLQNALRRASRREAREEQYAEERSLVRSETPRVAPRPRNVSAILRTLCAPSELPAAMARLSGERRTSVLARLLGLADFAEADPAA
jgi:DNA-directed RNA polymerase specialized sigma24 family protein